MKYIVVICLLLSGQAHAEETGIVSQRFSPETLSGFAKAGDAKVFVLSDQGTSPGYDAEKKTLDVTPVLKWLQEEEKEGDSRPLAVESLEELRKLILSEENHMPGLFAVGEPKSLGVSFKIDGKQGFIILGSSLVTIVWDNKYENALLNELGRKALRKWIKNNGEQGVDPNA